MKVPFRDSLLKAKSSLGLFRNIGLLATVALSVPFGAAPNSPAGEAPHEGMFPGRWSTGIKQIFGTSYESYDSNNRYSEQSSTAPLSKVWFTGGQGVVTEVMWPTVDTPQVRDLQFLISDGKTFFQEERRLSTSETRWTKDGVPEFIITNRDPQGRYVIEKSIFTDPSSDALIVKVAITRNTSGLNFYVLHNPAVGNTPMGDFGFVRAGTDVDQGLFAYQGQEAQALVVSVPLRAASASFSGPEDGYQDISKNLVMTKNYKFANDGEVVLTGELDIPATVGRTEFTMALGFSSGVESARQIAQSAVANVNSSEQLFVHQWESYQAKVEDLTTASLDGGALYRSSVAILKSMEDKTFEGAFVAAPNTPWGEHLIDNNSGPSTSITSKDRPRQGLTAGYHLVWPRDLYMMATTMMAIGDFGSATAALNRLRSAQLGPRDGDYPLWGHRKISKNGSWPQNFWVNGEPWWTGLQMDEVAMPVVLAYRLWDKGQIQVRDYWDMVSRAADMIEKFGPWSNQERWEESFGVSPSTVASEIAALWTAGKMAEAMGDMERARRYNARADKWAFEANDNIDAWTFTTSGGLGNGRYFVRADGASSFDQVWDPNDNLEFTVANNGGRHREKDVIDGGFLELVRFGVKSALDPNIVDTISEYDQYVRVDVPGFGPGFHRYLFDRYNYDDASGQQTNGMLWPLLTGERGHYELARAIEIGQSPLQLNATVNPYIQAMELFATSTHMIPEQVWDQGPQAGKATGSATPLGWSHGEYIKILRSKRDRSVFDDVRAVKERVEKLSPLSWKEIKDLGGRETFSSP